MNTHTLAKIRENQRTREAEQQRKLENYKSPSGGIILKNYIKTLNMSFIKEFCDDNQVSAKKKIAFIDKYHKIGYYTPTLTRYHQPEKDFINQNSL